jgi:hypothetical protein
MGTFGRRVMTMNKPVVSDRFDVEDIRKIREYNSLRHVNMTPAEIVEDTKKGSERVMKMLVERRTVQVCAGASIRE